MGDLPFLLGVGNGVGILAIRGGIVLLVGFLLTATALLGSLRPSALLVFLTALLTGFGIFDNIAKHAGGGTVVPITGFANSVASPAIDSRSEGYVLGVGAKIFTVCGPVILYGTLAGAIYGVIYYILGFFI